MVHIAAYTTINKLLAMIKPWRENSSCWYSSAFDKCIWWLVVDGRQAGDVTDQLVKQSRLQQISFLGDEGLLSQNNFLGSGRVSRQQSPVDVATVSQVRVVTVLHSHE